MMKNIERIQWVSINDNLPDAGSEVLVCFERNDCYDRDVTVASYDDSLEQPWEVSGGLSYFGTVLYWAEMPIGPRRSAERKTSTDKKTCPGCRTAKDRSEFHKNSKRKDGLHHYCKNCRRDTGDSYANRIMHGLSEKDY